MKDQVKIVECPRDAMQGILHFIDTSLKIEYINLLLKCNFDVLDLGSFVSHKAIPQMRDTAEVIKNIDLTNSKTEILTIVANLKGAKEALGFSEIHTLGYPLSISNTFQLRNTNKTIENSLIELDQISSLCINKRKKLVVYLSMGFGNPYGDEWNQNILNDYIQDLTSKMNIDTIALSDTIGIATPELVFNVFSNLINNKPNTELSAHLHVVPKVAEEILEAAFKGGCRRFDSAIKGFGGCPMASDKLTGNMPTEKMLSWLEAKNIGIKIDRFAFEQAYNFSSKIFSNG